MQKITYSIEQLHRGDWTYEDCPEASKTSFNEDKVWTQETYEYRKKDRPCQCVVTQLYCNVPTALQMAEVACYYWIKCFPIVIFVIFIQS